MAKQEKSLLIGNNYGILTMGGANTGLWEIAKCVKLNADQAVFEYPNGLNKFERKAVNYEDVYNLKECCEESIRNRPEYAASFKRYIELEEINEKIAQNLLKAENTIEAATEWAVLQKRRSELRNA